ncbi:Uncharacterized conserved protein, DUF2249 family [Halovenus aranensis]|jgi:uncharacterized protein (DUF2249 family)|uniref:Uncharacterized conserved protein, DUF2249 family n=1 Tax=Halovenus aranensis TaxID=890420 RepID=A0A1G8VSN8_9EURY|nr:DUF2249 domain-containing protein [Halovenus aranensis]SDJ68867.1 Uncharacterized conserved protein, DUF2249 family [Halovenus aranensis]
MTDLDLRERDGEYREAIFNALSARDVGDRLTVVADRDIDPHLARYQIERSEALDWTYAEPDAEPRRLQIRTCGERDGLGAVDVRDLRPQRRHEVLLETFDELDAGEGFVLINDHDPKPLYHRFDAEEGPEFTWEYRQKSPGEFRALVGKAQ